jgi:hypothetical protein
VPRATKPDRKSANHPTGSSAGSHQPAAVSFKDINTLSVLAPSLTPGPQQIVITNPDGETTSMDAAITVNQITPFSPQKQF